MLQNTQETNNKVFFKITHKLCIKTYFMIFKPINEDNVNRKAEYL